ncbi:hypothetical protein EVAR_39685_1 [Eumeta japonica]|uniref:Uncharacterized protein n=1 Tax=Eumeta variegata TaxID=151549 RepID=A0A4C1Z325_EUMVA|nr:hypothetical protein EVAR_39685_1 [Eumeta japonica]
MDVIKHRAPAARARAHGRGRRRCRRSLNSAPKADSFMRFAQGDLNRKSRRRARSSCDDAGAGPANGAGGWRYRPRGAARFRITGFDYLVAIAIPHRVRNNGTPLKLRTYGNQASTTPQKIRRSRAGGPEQKSALVKTEAYGKT